MCDLKRAAQIHEAKASECKERCRNQEETIKHLEEKVEKMELAMREQNSFLATLGLTLSALLWKASKDSQIVDMLIETVCVMININHCFPCYMFTFHLQGRLSDLFSIIGDVLKSFFEVYNEKLPPTKSEEVQFIISLMGVLVNITVRPEGRNSVIGLPQGREMIKHLVRYVSRFSDSNIQRYYVVCAPAIIFPTEESYFLVASFAD